VACNATTAFKRVGDNRYVKMPAAVFGTGMTGVQVALVFDQQLVGRKSFG